MKIIKAALILTVVSAALAFTIPDNAKNVKHSIDKNSNEHLSYSLGRIAVSNVTFRFRLSSADSLTSPDSESCEHPN